MRTIESPVEKFPGKVVLPDYLTMPQALAYENAIREAQNLGEDAVQSDYDKLMVPAICECVQEWKLEGFDDIGPQNFPFTPRVASVKLIAWLFGELSSMYSPDVPEE